MPIYLAVDVERQEGKNVSNDEVGEQLARSIEGESVDVEDSLYDVTSVEVIASPKKAATGIDDKALMTLDEVFTAYMTAFPPRIGEAADSPDPKENLTLDQLAFTNSFEKLLFLTGVGEAIQKAKQRLYKQAQNAEKRS